MFREGVIVFIEIQEEGKAPDLKYFSIASSEINHSDEYYIEKAKQYFKEETGSDAILVDKGVHRCKSLDELMLVLESQFS